jgi:methyl-accepting chemotaxis protein
MFISIRQKVNILFILIALLSLIIAASVLFTNASYYENLVHEDSETRLQQFANDQISFKKLIGLTNAISITNDNRIKKALRMKNKLWAKMSLSDISQNMQKDTPFNFIKVHIHTPDNHSFLRSWKLKINGDDLSNFRHDVVHINKTKIPINAFQIGRDGLSLRSIIPVIDNDTQHLGSLEFMQSVDSIVHTFERKDSSFVLLVNQNTVKDRLNSKSKFDNFSNLPTFKNYFISQKSYDKTFLNEAINIDFSLFETDGHILTSNYFYTTIPIKDYQNNQLGIALIGKPLTYVNQAVNQMNKIIYLALITIIIMSLALLISQVITIKILVQNPLKEFQNGLISFFNFLKSSDQHVSKININTNDEFGQMSEVVNSNIQTSIIPI